MSLYEMSLYEYVKHCQFIALARVLGTRFQILASRSL